MLSVIGEFNPDFESVFEIFGVMDKNGGNRMIHF